MKKIKNEGKFFDLNSRLSFNANYYFFMGRERNRKDV